MTTSNILGQGQGWVAGNAYDTGKYTDGATTVNRKDAVKALEVTKNLFLLYYTNNSITHSNYQ
tara:strand:- start:812 stop:1000 length:189 start_codon:yes stop_codon:yes gene_type:complete